MRTKFSVVGSPSPSDALGSGALHFKLPRKNLSVLVLVTLLALSLVAFWSIPLVQASDLIDSYSESNKNTQAQLQVTHPSAISTHSAQGQSFNQTLSTNHKITSCKFYLERVGSPGYMVAALYAHSGTYGSSSVPTGSALATSDPVDGTSVSNSAYELITFSFNSSQQYTMVANTYYCIAVQAYNGTWDNSGNYMNVGAKSSGTHPGNYFSYYSSAWSYVASYETCFYVYGDAPAAPTYTTIGSNETIAGNPVQCYVLWASGTGLSGFIFSTDNGSAAYTNQTWTATVSGWGNYTFRLNVTVGTAIHWKEYCNDTSNLWNTTSVQTITTIYYASITVNTGSHSWSLAPGQNNVTINENGGKISVTVTSNANFDIQAEASADLAYGPYTIALSNTNMSASTWTAAIPLTTGYQTVPGLSNVAGGTGLSESFYLWLSCPTGKPAGAYTYTLTVQVIQH
jgi:hypothetical protein